MTKKSGIDQDALIEMFSQASARQGEALRKDIRVMDQTAMTMCNDNQLSMRVFGMEGEGNVTRALLGESIGTVVHA